MSNIDKVMKAPASAGREAKPVEKFGGGFNAASPPAKTDSADDETETPCSKVTAFAAKPAPSGGRRPLFRR